MSSAIESLHGACTYKVASAGEPWTRAELAQREVKSKSAVPAAAEAHGKRLLELKANFGKIAGQCKKEIHNLLTLLQRGDLKIGMEAFCRMHSTCMESVEGDKAKEVFDCWGVALENKAYMLHSSKDFTPAQLQGTKDVLECFKNTEAADLPAHALDDLASLWSQYMKMG
ncbi:uncharacterized protein [Dermacentor albipictus]|uniref:uncharacterized protein isoform X1 n=1 Tax=Dermacentor albipictus TaxID=60249 RepID=UPI0038FD213E